MTIFDSAMVEDKGKPDFKGKPSKLYFLNDMSLSISMIECQGSPR